MTNSGSDSFFVCFLVARFKWVQKYCLLELLRRKARFPSSDCCTDLYVIGHLGLAVMAYALSFWVPWIWLVIFWISLVILYSAWRIIELVTFYLRQMIAHEPRVASPERSFVLALLNYFEVTLWFAVYYSVFEKVGSLKIAHPLPPAFSIFRESLAMMLVNSSSAFEPTGSWLVWTVMCVQSVVGLFLTLVVVARTVASLPQLSSSRRRVASSVASQPPTLP